jgi:hypothetical protein
MERRDSPPPARLDAILDLWSATGERTRLAVEGTCMQPLILEGDTVHVVHGKALPRLGDIVLFREDDMVKVQRVVRRERDSGRVLLKGDNESETGACVSPSQVLGVAVAVERNGIVVRFDRAPWVWLNRWIAWCSFREARWRQRRGIGYRLVSRMARRVPLGRLRPADLASRFVRTGRRSR